MKTRLTELLGIQYPVIQGGMAWISESGLTSAVSNAGGAGIIAAGGRDTDWLRAEIRKTKELTDKPFGVNLMLMAPNKDDIADLICQEKVDFVTLGAGNPVPYIEKFHACGIKVIPVVPNLKLAQRVAESGADAMVIEGMEAGGHIGSLTTMALMTNIIPHIDIPLIAAGGIADGRGLAAVLLMGAEGVQLGSKFLLTTECTLHPKAKARIIEATDTDSVATGFSRGTAVRCLKNTFTEEYSKLEVAGAPQEELDKLATGTNRMAAVDGDVEMGAILVSQSLVALNEIKSTKAVVEELIAEARETLKRACLIGK